jgi:hypothetical protein
MLVASSNRRVSAEAQSKGRPATASALDTEEHVAPNPPHITVTRVDCRHRGDCFAADLALAGARCRIRLKYGTALPDGHPMAIRSKEAAAKIKEESNGRLDIALYTSSVLGQDTALMSQAISGALEMYSLSLDILAQKSPSAAIFGVGFAFPDYATAWKAMDGDLGNYCRGLSEKVGLYCLDKAFDHGFRQITMKPKPINVPEDLKGIKVRLPVAPLFISLFQHLGASPTPINFGEVYSALQTGLVDGQENPLILIDTAKQPCSSASLSRLCHCRSRTRFNLPARVHYHVTDKSRFGSVSLDSNSASTPSSYLPFSSPFRLLGTPGSRCGGIGRRLSVRSPCRCPYNLAGPWFQPYRTARARKPPPKRGIGRCSECHIFAQADTAAWPITTVLTRGWHPGCVCRSHRRVDRYKTSTRMVRIYARSGPHTEPSAACGSAADLSLVSSSAARPNVESHALGS